MAWRHYLPCGNCIDHYLNQNMEITMIVTITSFKFNGSFTKENIRQAFTQSAAKFLNIPGLIHKYFLVSEDGKNGGGCYIWESREHAEDFFNDAWKQFIKDKYGSFPSVAFFDCPVEVDNNKCQK